MSPRAFTYLFDPLCGWCYGASPALRRLVALPGAEVEILPTGLFAGPGSRPMTAAFADYAWSNDQRIARLTGQPFTDTYRDQVLSDRTRRFDSGPATLALAAVALTAPPGEAGAREIDALAAVQTARYVDGRDITATATLAAILSELGLDAAAQLVVAPTAALTEFDAGRTARARALLLAVGAHGVPTLVLEDDPGPRQIDTGILYAGAAHFASAVMAR
jgi:putative protein-disulfide isomerase